ncbi:hypothetical protein J3E69DRAFT_321240 [Trichoderma sp. SZMC 28015]
MMTTKVMNSPARSTKRYSLCSHKPRNHDGVPGNCQSRPETPLSMSDRSLKELNSTPSIRTEMQIAAQKPQRRHLCRALMHAW